MAQQGEILFIVKADNKQAVDALNKVATTMDGVTTKTQKLSGATNNANTLLMSTGRIVQDMPYGFMGIANNIQFLSDQMVSARANGQSFTSMLKGMGLAMLGPAGIGVGISFLTTALTYLSMSSRKSSTEIYNFADALEKAKKSAKGLRDEIDMLKTKQTEAATPSFFDWIFAGGDRVNATTGKLKSGQYLAVTNQLRVLDEYKNKMQGFAQEIINNGKNIGQVVRDNMLKRPDLEFIKSYLDDELDKIPMVSGYYNKYADAIKAVNEQLSLNVKVRKEINNLTVSGVPGARGFDLPTMDLSGKNGWFYRGQVKGVRGGQDQRNEILKGLADDFYNENQLFIESVKASADTLRDAFIDAWRDIFGEANSLVEKLFANIAAQIANTLSMKAAGSFLDWIIPGAATLLGLPMFNKTGGITIINQMGDEEVSRVVVKGIGQAQRLRML